jgi:hypothetical protein
MKPHFPMSLSEEFLLVDLVNNVDSLAEEKSVMLDGVAKKVLSVDPKALGRAVREYGGVKAKKFFEPLINRTTLNSA